jgi:hypothetical protein
MLGRPFGPNYRYVASPDVPNNNPPAWSFRVGEDGEVHAMTNYGTVGKNWLIFESLKQWIHDVDKHTAIQIPTSYRAEPSKKSGGFAGLTSAAVNDYVTFNWDFHQKEAAWFHDKKNRTKPWEFKHLKDVYVFTPADATNQDLLSQLTAMHDEFNKHKLRFDATRVGIERLHAKPPRVVYFGFGEQTYYSKRTEHELRPRLINKPGKWVLAPANSYTRIEDPSDYEPRGDTHWETLQQQFSDPPWHAAQTLPLFVLSTHTRRWVANPESTASTLYLPWTNGEQHNLDQYHLVLSRAGPPLVPPGGGGAAAAPVHYTPLSDDTESEDSEDEIGQQHKKRRSNAELASSSESDDGGGGPAPPTKQWRKQGPVQVHVDSDAYDTSSDEDEANVNSSFLDRTL